MPIASRRRNNAPVNPPREPSLVPEPLICIAIALAVMGGIFFAFSYLGIFADGDTGRTLARLFGASLLISGLLLFLLGIGLLGDVRGRARLLIWPALLGIIIGGASAGLFVAETGEFVLAPFALAILTVRPVRKLLGVAKGGRR